jgi:flagellar protein FliS
MKKSQTELTYMRAAAQNATPAGLVVILYDLLVHDLEQAIAAFAAGDVEGRTAEIKHAFVVLQQLEGSLSKEDAPEDASRLSRFYSTLRRNILAAQIKANPEILRRQIELVLDVRQAWQQVDKPNLGSGTGTTTHSAVSQGGAEQSMAADAGGGDAASVSWTA